jgi:Flp pilus assembly protein TadG
VDNFAVANVVVDLDNVARVDNIAANSKRRTAPMPPRTLKPQRGAVILEAAFVVPLLLMLILGGLDLTLLARARSNVDWIARQAASCSATQGCDVQALAASNAAGLSMPGALSVVINAPGAVTVTYSWAPVGPFLSATTLTATAEVPNGR